MGFPPDMTMPEGVFFDKSYLLFNSSACFLARSAFTDMRVVLICSKVRSWFVGP
jgi:hypothetical protein